MLSWWHDNSPFSSFDGIICDGSVRSGKTVSMSLSFVLWACTKFNNTDFAICGKTITSVKRNIAVSLLDTLRKYDFNVSPQLSRNMFIVSFHGHSNRFYFFGGKDESSSALIQGMTLGGVLLDEVALMPESFVSQAVARCSPEGAKFWFNCNPDNPHHWFYEKWIKKAEEKNCLYIHFTMDDNPSLSQKVKDRYKSIYTGSFYDRYILGKWVVAGGLVYPDTAEKWLGIKQAPRTVADEYVISVDYGTVNPFSAGLWGRYGDEWYRTDEFYFSSRSEGYQKTDEEYYTDIECLADGRNIRAVIVDPSAASFIETVRRHGKFNVKKADNDVLCGIRKVQCALKDGQIFIDPCCTDCIREFSLYKWNEKGAKDSVKKQDDHAMDDVRYFVATYLKEDECDGIFMAVDR